MKPWKTLAEGAGPKGEKLVLQQRGEEYVIRVGGQVLMSSRSHGSEDAMAESALEGLAQGKGPRILVGGLGLGFTLRAVLDRAPSNAHVRVAELVKAVVEWNRGAIGELAGRPLDDKRVEVFTGDVLKALAQGGWNAILLDVDNGPSALTQESNASLYDQTGLARLQGALAPGGTLVIWSAGEDPRFVRALEKTGLSARMRTVRAHGESGARHTLFIAQRR